MPRTFFVALGVAAAVAAPLSAQSDPDSIQAWTGRLETGSIPEKVYAASKLASLDVTTLPAATIDAAVAALVELETLSSPIPGAEQLGDEDFAGYQVDLVVLGAVADETAADLGLVPSVAVSVGVRRIVAQLGDAAVPLLASMIAGGDDVTAALETLGLSWFWADSVAAPLSEQSRATIVDLFTSATESMDFRTRLGAAVALGNSADPALLPLAEDFRDRLAIEDPRLVGVVDLDAIGPLEQRHEEATASELMAGTSRLTSAICFGATGDLADACVTMISGLEDAALFLAAADTVAAARALDDVRLAAGSALRAGALGSAQFVLLSGGAGQAQPQPAVADGLQGIADDIGVIIQVASDPLLIDRMQDILDMVEVGAAALLTVPPDGAAAAAAIEDATQELDAAVDAGLLNVTTGEELMSRLAGLVRRLATDAVIEAIARGGNPTRIDEALLGIDNGDASVMAGAFPEATTAFETALQDAQGA